MLLYISNNCSYALHKYGLFGWASLVDVAIPALLSGYNRNCIFNLKTIAIFKCISWITNSIKRSSNLVLFLKNNDQSKDYPLSFWFMTNDAILIPWMLYFTFFANLLHLCCLWKQVFIFISAFCGPICLYIYCCHLESVPFLETFYSPLFVLYLESLPHCLHKLKYNRAIYLICCEYT